MLILNIDTIGEKTEVELSRDQETVDSVTWLSRRNQTEELLGAVDSMLTRNKVKKSDLEGIRVNNLPGSYTGGRVGITTANFLAFSLNIPVFGSEQAAPKPSSRSAGLFHSPVLPLYQREPFITKPKSGLK